MKNYTITYYELEKKNKAALMNGFKAVNNKIFSGLKEKLKSVWEKAVEQSKKAIQKIQEGVAKYPEKQLEKAQDEIANTNEKLSAIASAQSEYDDYLGKLNSKARTLRSDKEFETIIKLEKDLYKLDESMEKNTKKFRKLLKKEEKYKKALGLDKIVQPIVVKQTEAAPLMSFPEISENDLKIVDEIRKGAVTKEAEKEAEVLAKDSKIVEEIKKEVVQEKPIENVQKEKSTVEPQKNDVKPEIKTETAVDPAKIIGNFKRVIEENEQLRKAKSQDQEQIERLKKQNQKDKLQSNKAITEAQAKNLTQSSEISNLQKKLAEANNSLSATEKAKEIQEEKTNNANKENEILKAQLLAANEALNKQAIENEKLRREIASVKSVQDELKKMQTIMAAFESRLSSQNTVIETLQKEKESKDYLLSQYESSFREIANMESSVDFQQK